MAEQISKKNILDIATALTVGGIILYQMGWIYWTNYFSVFNIDASFIEMPFEKFIATTWYISLIILLSFTISAIHVLESESEKIDPATAVVSVTLALLFVFEKHFKDLTFLILFAGIVIVFWLYLVIATRFNFITSSKSISKKKFFYALLCIMYVLAFIVYSGKGGSDAEKLIKNFKKPDIEIFCNNKARASGKFISFMNGKYFIIIKDKKGKNQTFILNDSEVHHVKFIK